MKLKRRHFLIGGAALAGAGVFGVKIADMSAASRAKDLVVGKGEGGFATWLKIAADDTITLYSPHIDFGQGSQTALAQMLADELDGDWSKIMLSRRPLIMRSPTRRWLAFLPVRCQDILMLRRRCPIRCSHCSRAICPFKSPAARPLFVPPGNLGCAWSGPPHGRR